jgi:hypothetical protein
MPLPVYDTEDAVPQDQREDFAEHEGKWRHKVEIEAAGERKKRLQLLTEKKDADEKRKDAEAKLAEAERVAAARAAGVSETELQKIRDAEAAARKPIEDENATLKADLRKLKLTDKVQALYLDPKIGGGMPDRIEDAMDQLAKRTDLGDKDGIVFKDKDGSVTTDDAVTFFRKFKLEKPWLFASAGGSGSGAPSGGGRGSDTTTTERPTAERTEQHRSAVASAL